MSKDKLLAFKTDLTNMLIPLTFMLISPDEINSVWRKEILSEMRDIHQKIKQVNIQLFQRDNG